MSWDTSEIAAMFCEYAQHETGGEDPITAAALYHIDRWAEYEAERRAERERNAAFAQAERERWARANATRKRKRRGLHLSNEERVRIADLTSAGVVTPEDVARETGVSVATAGRLSQLLLDVGEP